MISRRLVLASVCATAVCLTSCGNPSRAEFKSKLENKLETTTVFSWENHQKTFPTKEWLGVEEYITYPEHPYTAGKCGIPQLYRWNYKANKYVYTRWF